MTSETIEKRDRERRLQAAKDLYLTEILLNYHCSLIICRYEILRHGKGFLPLYEKSELVEAADDCLAAIKILRNRLHEQSILEYPEDNAILDYFKLGIENYSDNTAIWPPKITDKEDTENIDATE